MFSPDEELFRSEQLSEDDDEQLSAAFDDSTHPTTGTLPAVEPGGVGCPGPGDGSDGEHGVAVADTAEYGGYKHAYAVGWRNVRPPRAPAGDEPDDPGDPARVLALRRRATSHVPRGFRNPEAWMSAWEEELVVVWHLVEDHCRANGYAILDACTFPAFADFCWRQSSQRIPAPQ